MKKQEIFKPGRFVALDGREIEFSEADLKAIAAVYDPSLHEAPLVVGHPKSDLPAHGWVKHLEFSETSQRLLIEPDQVDPQFAEMVNSGLFKKISASFYPPGSPQNPAPADANGKKPYYLRHVGFLGAQPPSVKGLKSASFAAGDEDFVTLEFGEGDWTIAGLFRSLREWMISKWNKDEADKAIPGYAVQTLERLVTENNLQEKSSPEAGFAEGNSKEEPMKLTPEELAAKEEELKKQSASFSERETGLTKKEGELSERQKKIEADEARIKRAEFGEFVGRLASEGRVLPAAKSGLVEFMSELSDAGAIEFGEGDKKVQKTPLEFFKDFLSALPKQVAFGEFAGSDGSNVELSAEALAAKAVEFQESESKAGRHISAAQAVEIIKKGGAK